MGKTRESVERIDFDSPKSDHLDDLAITGDRIAMLRLERMSGGNFWGKVYMKDGRELRLSFGATYGQRQGKLEVIAEWE